MKSSVLQLSRVTEQAGWVITETKFTSSGVDTSLAGWHIPRLRLAPPGCSPNSKPCPPALWKSLFWVLWLLISQPWHSGLGGEANLSCLRYVLDLCSSCCCKRTVQVAAHPLDGGWDALWLLEHLHQLLLEHFVLLELLPELLWSDTKAVQKWIISSLIGNMEQSADYPSPKGWPGVISAPNA